MKHYQILALFFSTLLLTKTTWAEQSYPDAATQPHFTCMAYDSEQKQWAGESTYAITASNKALDGCKKQSHFPESCKIAKEQCQDIEQFTSAAGPSQALWRCTALDQAAKTWVGNTYSQGDAAAIAAKEYCRKNSSIPDSCYVNLLTCVNINAGS